MNSSGTIVLSTKFGYTEISADEFKFMSEATEKDGFCEHVAMVFQSEVYCVVLKVYQGLYGQKTQHELKVISKGVTIELDELVFDFS